MKLSAIINPFKVKRLTRVSSTICLAVIMTLQAFSQSSERDAMLLNDLDVFRNPDKNWILVSDISTDYIQTRFKKYNQGKGTLLALKPGRDLQTKNEFGDIELDFDFMPAGKASSGLLLQGRYMIQLADSWAKPHPLISDMGGVSWTQGAGQISAGRPPLTNVAKAPGLWQHLKVIFTAPQFESGRKVKNARLEQVYLNGVLIHSQVELPSPSAEALFKDESASGPLVFLAGTGNVAFRNISCKPPLNAVTHTSSRRVTNPILLNPDDKPYLLRSFLNFKNKKLTHVVSVGNPSQLHYSYDLKQGALLQVWHGGFLDVTNMWEERGEPQTASPLGSVIVLSDAPALAVLNNLDSPWPGPAAFETLESRGYTLNKSRQPAFEYSYLGAVITDNITAQSNGRSLLRQIKVSNAPKRMYCRAALADKIEQVEKGLYVIGERQYYIKVDKSLKPFIRETQQGKELLLSLDENGHSIAYSIIW